MVKLDTFAVKVVMVDPVRVEHRVEMVRIVERDKVLPINEE